MSINFIGDGSLDAEDRQMVRHALSAYSRAERVTLRRFIDLLIATPFLRGERILRIFSCCLDEGEVKREERHFRVVDEVDDG